MDPIILTACRFPNSMTIVPTTKPDLPRRAITEFFKDAMASLTNVFLTVLVKEMSSRNFQCVRVCIK
jgi:hypothetical protein